MSKLFLTLSLTLDLLNRHTIHSEYNLDLSTVSHPRYNVADSSMEHYAVDCLDTDGTVLH